MPLENYGGILVLLLLFRHCVPSLFGEAWIAHIRLFLLFDQRFQFYWLLLFFLSSRLHFARRRQVLAFSLLRGIISISFMASQSRLVKFTPIFRLEFLDGPVNFLIAHNIEVLVANGCLLLVLPVF